MKKSKKTVQRILTLLIVACFAVAGYFLFSYFNGNAQQWKNSETALLKANDVIKTKVDYRKTKVDIGKVIGKIRVEGLTDDMPIIEGDSLDLAMAHGVGHIQSTPQVGSNTGQPAFSGHRETFFKALQNVKNGDVVVVSMPYGTYRYKITHHIITGSGQKAANKIYSTAGIKTERIVLITCYPFSPLSNPSKRIAFYGDLIE